MQRICILFGVLILFGISNLSAQVSSDCGNATPICNDTPVNGGTSGFGVDDFNGAVNSGCLERTITNAIESNSAWYRFRTGASGQLGFNIGTDTSEDWDFALYKASDCSMLSEPIRCNFFDNQDRDAFLGVGEDPTGNAANIQYEDWIEVAPGEDYYLLINNFSNNNSGFSIQFSGNIFVTNPLNALDCSIVSNLLGPPVSACEGSNQILNAYMPDASSYEWYVDNGAGFQQILGEDSSELVVSVTGTYQVRVVRPGEIDLISKVYVGFSTMPTSFPLTDEAVCSVDDIFDLSLKDVEVLGSQSPDDFVVSYHNTFEDANNGTNTLPKELPIPSATPTIYVRVTSVENPDCFDTSQQFQLIRLETPDLNFPSEVFLCDGETSITIGASISNPFCSYSWDTGQMTSSIEISAGGTYTLTATNTQNEISCSNSRTVSVIVSHPPVISTIDVEDLQEVNTITVNTTEPGDWEYQLDDGSFQTSPTFTDVLAGLHMVTVNDLKGCGSDTEQVVVVGFPKFFTPNGDGMYDYWQIAGVGQLENPLVSIYDRYGKLITQLTQDSQGWDGTLAGRPLPATDYWFKLTYMDINGQIAEAKYVNNHFSLKR